MQLPPNPGISVNVAAVTGTAATRENAAAMPMRMNINKVNFFYGPK